MTSLIVTKEVDVDDGVLADFDDDVLADELRGRGYVVVTAGDPAIAAYHSLHGMLDYLPEPARQFILDAAGRVA